jgi:hypothetical protein
VLALLAAEWQHRVEVRSYRKALAAWAAAPASLVQAA